MLDRDSRTLSKLFERVVNSPDEHKEMLVRARDILNTEQRKFIVGLRY